MNGLRSLRAPSSCVLPRQTSGRFLGETAMRILRALVLSLPLLSAPLLHATDADACGGCLINQQESTQVTGHRMVLSISNDRTTLWDQITYSGDPTSFAWVLPIKGTVEIGLSSDG